MSGKIDECVKNVYYIMWRLLVKYRDLVKRLQRIGFEFERYGGNHDIYKRGDEEEQIF